MLIMMLYLSEWHKKECGKRNDVYQKNKLFVAGVPLVCRKAQNWAPGFFFIIILMINDLRVSNVRMWKYVDDTTIAEIAPKGGRSNIQSAVDAV